MLAPHDVELVSRDTRLPGLATVLDPERLAQRLIPWAPEVEAHAPEILYVRYKPGTSCLVGYRVAGVGEPRLFYVKAHATELSAKFEKACARAALVCDPLITVVPRARDRVLTGIMKLEPEYRVGLLSRLLPERNLREPQIHTLRYKPERRYVGAVVVDGRASAVVRLYTELSFTTARARAGAFEPRDGLQVPRLIGNARRYHALALEWAEGETLHHELIEGPAPWALAARVGRALAELHCQDATALPRQTVRRFVRHLKAVAHDVAMLSPHLAVPARRLVKRLVVRLEAEAFIPCAIHGDLHAGQVLVNGDDITLLDFDRAARADAANDLGTFLAHLEREHLRGTVDAARVDAIKDGLLAGYSARAAHVPAQRTELYLASALLQLAPHAFRDRERDWPHAMALMLDRAEQIIETRSHARIG